MSGECWPANSPQTLLDTCLQYCAKHLDSTFCYYDSSTNSYQLKPWVSLPPSVFDELFQILSLTREHLDIFRDPELAPCKRFNLELIGDLKDTELLRLLTHRPTELRLSSEQLTSESVENINTYGQNLNTLTIVGSSSIFVAREIEFDEDLDIDDVHFDGPVGHRRIDGKMFGRDYVFECPQLRSLTIRRYDGLLSTLDCALSCLTLLTKLDLSDSEISIDALHSGISNLRCLHILRLQNVPLNTLDVKRSFQVIANLKSLRVLDIAQSQAPYFYAGDLTASMSFLMSSLPLLTHLDLSGTNLAGWINNNISHRPSSVLSAVDDEVFPVPGLEGHYLEFLGLLNCPYHACERECLPAKQVTGDANEQQVLLSIEVYVDSVEFLVHSLNELFNQLKDGHCSRHYRALQGILAAMKQHRAEKRVQISGSASLFYIVKGEGRHNLTTQLKRTIITRLLDAMDEHLSDATMLRNACLTLCHFTLPHDVLFCYERLVELLLRMMLMKYEPNDTFIQCIGVNILNSLACQVDYKEKRLLGQLGAIDTMLKLINERLECGLCDEVMLYSWSMMWNVTDETDINCQRFIDQQGLQLFNKCRKKFPDQEELLRNMMGLMGNVAEVEYLRPCLMQSSYLSSFSDLLKSVSNGIEVSYNACGVLANLMSDGPAAWTVESPSRNEVLANMVTAIESWKLSSKRNINYRSFKPILRLIPMHETPQIQYWGVWALCNLTKVNRVKYCPLLEKEGGLLLLAAISTDTKPYPVVRTLAQQVLSRCHRYNASPSAQTADDDTAAAAGGSHGDGDTTGDAAASASSEEDIGSDVDDNIDNDDNSDNSDNADSNHD